MAANGNDEGYSEAMEVMMVRFRSHCPLRLLTNTSQQDLGIGRREVLSTQDDMTRLASDHQKRLFAAQNRVDQSETDPITIEQKNAWKCE